MKTMQARTNQYSNELVGPAQSFELVDSANRSILEWFMSRGGEGDVRLKKINDHLKRFGTDHDRSPVVADDFLKLKLSTHI